MTESIPEPTLTDIVALLEAIAGMQQAHGRSVAEVRAQLDVVRVDVIGARHELSEKIDGVQDQADSLKADVAQLRADVASVKQDTLRIHRAVARLQDELHVHVADPGAHDHPHAA